MRCLKLPFHFDAARLRADLARVQPNEWIPHVNRRHYDGEWSGAALRAIGGSATNIVPDARAAEVFRDTALLSRCPYFGEVLATIKCPLQAVRLLRLHAHSNIAEHVDRALEFEDGEVRLHVPIVTNEAVRFYLDGARLVMAPGECWYTNVNLPHSVENASDVDRIHLVLDCVVNDWLSALFAATPPLPTPRFAARLTASRAPAIGGLLGAFSASAGDGAIFSSSGMTFVLSWRGRHTWQIRFRLPADTDSSPWRAELESSPDPEATHRGDFERLMARLSQAVPEAQAEVLSCP